MGEGPGVRAIFTGGESFNVNDQEAIRVLIAEDDYLVGQMVKSLLEDMAYQIVGEATDGLEAVALTRSLRPDVVLMDIKMPDMDGLEAIRHISDRCPTPVVVLSAYDNPELVHEASQVGAGAYLVKPPDAQEMERAISVAIARFEDMVALRRLNAELQTRNEELDTFAHTVAHDLQSSLTLMITLADTLCEHHATLSTEELEQYLREVVQRGHKLSNIISELLLLASVRQQDVALQPLDMAKIVNSARNRLNGMIKEYQAEIIAPETWPRVRGYAPWVEEVWVNYISNAIKYGGRPPQVELGATPHEDDLVRFWVLDNGDGLTPDEQTQLFKPFTRLDPVRAKGQGLGLSIVRQIVKKLGGQVGVESTGLAGQGSTFTFTLTT
jgi:signal transduction histidine kinase